MGAKAAEEPCIFIKVPSQCKVIEPNSLHFAITKDAPWHTFVHASRNEINIRGDSLTPGLRHESSYIWVIFPKVNETYELEYSAYANNLSDPDCGKLKVHIASKDAPPTKDFPGARELP